MTEHSTHTAPAKSATHAALFAVALTSVATYYLFGLIHKFTHHRPLGAATLAVLLFGIFLGAWAFGARVGVGRTAAGVTWGLALLHVVVRALL